MSDFHIHPIEGVVVIEPYEEKISPVLALPGNMKYRDQVGKVVAVGAPVMDARLPGVLHYPPCKVDDIIVHQTYYSEPYTDFKTGKKYKFVRFEHVEALISERE